MIGKLKGIVEAVFNDALMLDVRDVGYIVYVPSHILHKVNAGDELTLYVEQLIRPEIITLYGFLDLNEKLIFQKLISVQGIGGKAANAILSVLSPTQLLSAILSEDASAIKQADGVGPKVASRVIVELKSFAQKHALNLEPGVHEKQPPVGSAYADALSILIQLGYKSTEAQKALELISSSDLNLTTAESIVPEALKRLAKNFL